MGKHFWQANHILIYLHTGPLSHNINHTTCSISSNHTYTYIHKTRLALLGEIENRPPLLVHLFWMNWCLNRIFWCSITCKTGIANNNNWMAAKQYSNCVYTPPLPSSLFILIWMFSFGRLICLDMHRFRLHIVALPVHSSNSQNYHNSIEPIRMQFPRGALANIEICHSMRCHFLTIY